MKVVLFLSLFVLFVVASAYPLEEEEEDDLELVQLVPLNRYPRGLTQKQQQMQRIRPSYYQNQPRYEEFNTRPYLYKEPLESSSSKKEPLLMAESGGHGHSPYEYVDYGAYTGGYGAFGWYSDHPVGGH